MPAFPSIDLSAYVANIPLKQRIALGGILLVLVILGYWQLFLKSELAARNSARLEAAQLKQEMEQTRRIVAQKPHLEQEIKLLQARLARAILQLPEEKEIPSLLSRVARLGQETNLEVTLFKPGNTTPKEFYMEVPVQLKVIGSYHSLGMLFERFTRLERIVNVGDLTIRPSGKDPKAGATILAEFGVLTYTYTGSGVAKKP